MNKFIKLHIFILTPLALISNALYAMEHKFPAESQVFGSIPETCGRIMIDSKTIGALAVHYSLSESEKDDVITFRNTYKNLITDLLDFTYDNSQYNERHKENVERIKVAGLNYVGNHCNVFQLPNNQDLFFQSSGPLYRVINLSEKTNNELYRKFWNKEEVTAEEWNNCEKQHTFQTVSRFASYMQFLLTAREHEFTYFSVLKTALFALNDGQSVEEYHDGNSFVIQKRMPQEYVLISAEKDRLAAVDPKAIEEICVAINYVGIWDLSSLYITPANTFVIRNLQQSCDTSPDYFFNRGQSHLNDVKLSGYEQLYNLCDGHSALQEVIQDYVCSNLALYGSMTKEEKDALGKAIGLEKTIEEYRAEKIRKPVTETSKKRGRDKNI